MSDYVERRQVIEEVYQVLKRPSNHPDWQEMLMHIQSVPAADVRPVVRGEWVPSDMQEGWITCSVCKKLKLDGRMALSPDLFEEWGLHFCPNCGASMRGEAK